MPLNDDVANADAEPDAAVNKNPDDPLPSDQPVTTSVRGTYRLLKSHGGYAAFLRGFGCIVVYGVAQSIVYGILSSLLPRVLAPFATILSMLCVVQLGAAWVHIIITPKSPLHFWQRLPPFGKTFRATYAATLLYFVAKEASAYAPYLVAKICGLTIPDFSKPHEEWGEDYGDSKKSWVVVPIVLTSIVTWALLQIPSRVVLVRIQASLLPPEAHTIVPFDRSFGGRVEPVVVGGKGYATIKEAIATFGLGSWKRLYMMCIKIFMWWSLLVVAMSAIVMPQLMLMKKFAPPTEGGGDN